MYIYSQTANQLPGWDDSWNSSSRPVYYNVSENTFAEIDGIQYVVDGNKVILTHCLSTDESIEVPSSITINETTYDVTTLARYAFYNCDNLTLYCYYSYQEARQKWGNNWSYGCDVSYNYSD